MTPGNQIWVKFGSGERGVLRHELRRGGPRLLFGVTATLRQVQSIWMGPSPFFSGVLKVRIKMKIHPGSGPKSAQNHRSPYENENPDPPLDPLGGGGGQEQINKRP